MPDKNTIHRIFIVHRSEIWYFSFLMVLSVLTSGESTLFFFYCYLVTSQHRKTPSLWSDIIAIITVFQMSELANKTHTRSATVEEVYLHIKLAIIFTSQQENFFDLRKLFLSTHQVDWKNKKMSLCFQEEPTKKSCPVQRQKSGSILLVVCSKQQGRMWGWWK